MSKLIVSIPADDARLLLHLDANRCGMNHPPYRQLMAELREMIVEQIGAEDITPEREEK